jgi:hypothetical protein
MGDRVVKREDAHLEADRHGVAPDTARTSLGTRAFAPILSAMQHAALFSDAFGPENGTSYRLSEALAAAFPERAIVQTTSAFGLESFAAEGLCEARIRPSPHPEIHTHWRRAHGLSPSVSVGIWDVTWNNRALVVAGAAWPEGYSSKERSWIIAEDRNVAEEFTRTVCAWSNELRREVLTFRGGCWERDREIWETVQAASFDDLVLAGDLSREIREDFSSFMAARKEYERYGVPWKRGVLFVGPPGNGKTHCLRAVIRMLGVPCLYVQSLKSRYETDDANIARVFDRAREVTPCCLVFEDLDAMITSENRSLFLNQLDGFANASGMLTLATTNHPEKLDPAIVERPSRFDRKYHFGLPSAPERTRYIAGWRERLDAAMRMTDGEVEQLVLATDEFSFAYLKELFISATMRWIGKREPGTMFTHLEGQLHVLRTQMRSDPSPTPATSPPDPARMPFG